MKQYLNAFFFFFKKKKGFLHRHAGVLLLVKQLRQTKCWECWAAQQREHKIPARPLTGCLLFFPRTNLGLVIGYLLWSPVLAPLLSYFGLLLLVIVTQVPNHMVVCIWKWREGPYLVLIVPSRSVKRICAVTVKFAIKNRYMFQIALLMKYVVSMIQLLEGLHEILY